MNFLERLSRILDDVTSTISGILMSVLSILTLIGVFFRYVLGSPLEWSYELSIVSFAWMIFLGTAMAFKNHEHISINMVVDHLSPKVGYYWKQVINIIIMIFLILVVYHGMQVAMKTMGQKYNTIPLSKGVFYLSFPIAALPALVHVLHRTFKMRNDYKGGAK